MQFKVHLREALINLFSAKLRSILAILGVLVGTAAVVALMASSRLVTDHALSEFKTLGTNLLSMSVRQINSAKNRQKERPHLTLDHVHQLAKASPQIVLAAPYVNFYKPIGLYGQSFAGDVIGATEALQSIAKLRLAKGRFISDFDSNGLYCVIGSAIAKKFTQHHVSPLGKQVRVGNNLLTIVGVVAPWKPSLFLLVNVNRAVIVPIKSAYLIQGNAQIHHVLFRLVAHPKLALVEQKLSTQMTRLLPQMKARFHNPEQIIRLIGRERKTFDHLLIAIGAIALVVGGIGVMNIMLVSVVERRREIGVRMAVGAKRSNILGMFLIEAVLLTAFGGLVGVTLGVAVTYVLAHVAHWGFHFYLTPPLLGFLVSVFVGIVSGFYPAWRASKLDPIACLTL